MNIHFPTPFSQFNLDRYIRFISGCPIATGPRTETHHILPKCIGGTDDTENLITIPTSCHFIAHWMLWKAYRSTPGLSYAFSLMATPNKNHTGRTRKINSKTYSLLKADQSAAQSQRNKDRWNDPEWATRQSAILSKAASTPAESSRRSANALKINAVYKEKRSAAHRDRWNDPEWAESTKQKMKDKWKDVEWAEQNKKRINDFNLRKRIPIIVDGIEYISANEVSAKFNITKPAVRYRIKSPNFPFWSYLPENAKKA